jgi:hypothetical protein
MSVADREADKNSLFTGEMLSLNSFCRTTNGNTCSARRGLAASIPATEVGGFTPRFGKSRSQLRQTRLPIRGASRAGSQHDAVLSHVVEAMLLAASFPVSSFLLLDDWHRVTEHKASPTCQNIFQAAYLIASHACNQPGRRTFKAHSSTRHHGTAMQLQGDHLITRCLVRTALVPGPPLRSTVRIAAAVPFVQISPGQDEQDLSHPNRTFMPAHKPCMLPSLSMK